MGDDDPPESSAAALSHFDQALTEVRAHLAERHVTVSRTQLRRAIVVYSTREDLSPIRAAREVQTLLAKRVLSLAELIALE